MSPISALWVDEGWTPPASAGSTTPRPARPTAFAEALRAQGVRVTGPVRRATADRDADELAAVSSAPLSQVAERVIEISDNEGAEVLARHVALARDQDPSFAGAGRAVTATLGDLGVPLAGVVLHDGSGLSRDNRLDRRGPGRRAAGRRRPGPARPAPAADRASRSAGFTGSLATRFDTGPRAGLGLVRAKTGTLTGVRALAGVATDQAGTPMAFVLSADRIRLRQDTVDAEQAARRAGRRSRRLPLHPLTPRGRGCRSRVGSPTWTPWSTGTSRPPSAAASPGRGRSVTADEAAAVVAELRAAADRSTGLVRDFTGLVAEERTAPVLVVDRAGWVQANSDGVRDHARAGHRQARPRRRARRAGSPRPSAPG